MTRNTDAVVVGSGPNGLAAAIRLAEAGLSVQVLEASATPGGGTRTQELTEPGYQHDVCSAIHPLALASPFFAERGFDIDFVHPDAPLAHPLDDGTAVVLERSVESTAARFGTDRAPYSRLMAPLVKRAESLTRHVLAPLPIPRDPLLMARFGFFGLRSAKLLARRFDTTEARALVGGIAAHSMLPLTTVPTAAVALVLGYLAHAYGWPMARSGTARITDALVDRLESLGGELTLDHEVRRWGDIPSTKAVLLDVTPRQVLRIAGDRLPARFRRALASFRYNPGVFKIDWALSEPVPWKSPECARGGTIHIGGTFEEVAESEADVNAGRIPERPFVLLAQQSLFDETRAPVGKHTLWGYCHVPHGSGVDMTDRMEAQIERFAPGFRDCVIARHTMAPTEMEHYNANYIGGDINGGVQDLRQLYTRPSLSLRQYVTPAPGVYLCSSSTPPGGGVHGMCGLNAAETVLRREFGARKGPGRR